MKYTDDQLISRVESIAEGFEGWREGMYFVAVRSNADVPDAFDDKGYLFECKADGSKPDFRMVVTCTTNAGTDGLREFDNPTRKYNRAGCAVLEADRIVYDSHSPGAFRNYVAYRQVKGFPYYRDTDKDLHAEQQGSVKTDIIFAHIHRASATMISKRNFNWSIACVVLNNPAEFKALMARCEKRPISLCILQEF